MASYRMGCSHLVPSEILRQDPVVDVFRDTGEGSVDHLCAGSLGDALRDGPSVGCIGEGEKLAVDTTSHLQNNQQKYILKKTTSLNHLQIFNYDKNRGCGYMISAPGWTGTLFSHSHTKTLQATFRIIGRQMKRANLTLVTKGTNHIGLQNRKMFERSDIYIQQKNHSKVWGSARLH